VAKDNKDYYCKKIYDKQNLDGSYTWAIIFKTKPKEKT